MAPEDQNCLKKLKTMREELNWKDDNERRELYYQLLTLTKEWEGQLPNLREIFRPDEIYWLLTQNYMRHFYDRILTLIKFVIRTGYKDEPELDIDGNPLLRQRTPVHYAAKHEYPQRNIIRELFKIYDRFDVNYTDESGLTHFHVACKFGFDDIVEKFLEFGQDPNCLVTKTDDSPLHLALVRRHKEVTRLLLKSGANPNLTNKDGSTPLHIVCYHGYDDDLAEIFLKINDDMQQTVQIDAQNKLGDTPLHLAAKCANKKAVESLLRRDADPNLANKKGLTPVHTICESYDDDVSAILLKLFFEINDANHKTVQVNRRDKFGSTPLHYALEHGHENKVKLLLRRGANPNMADKNGSTPLHYICEHWIDDVVETLFKINDELQQAVQVDARDKLGRTPLHLAMSYQLKKVAEWLLRKGANLSLADEEGLTPLHLICDTGCDHETAIFLKTLFEIDDANYQTVQIDAQDPRGRTPLHLVLTHKGYQTAELLLKRDANPNLADAEGSTPLHIICQKYHDDEMATFLKIFFEISDANQQTVVVDALDYLGNTPLHLSLPYYTNKKTVKLLLSRGANPNLANAKGLTALHLICNKSASDDDDFVELFFKMCDDQHQTLQVDAQDKSGRTPLQCAVANLALNTVDILLNYGADLFKFIFPAESLFDEHLEIFEDGEDEFKLERASSALAVVERLENKGYETTQSDALTIMKIFAKLELFHKPGNLEFQLNDEYVVRTIKELMIVPSLSLYDFILLPAKEAEKLLTYKDYFKFAHPRYRGYSYFLPDGPCQPFVAYLGEIMSRGFFRRWGLEFFLALTHYQLPILCCDKIIDQLTNEELYGMCLATEIVAIE